MLPNSHIAYTWAATLLAQGYWELPEEVDYRLIALAATGPDLIDKPLAWAYFYRKYRSAVLFAHTLLVHIAVLLLIWQKFSQWRVYGVAFVGHAVLDRLWFYPNTFYWPFRGWRFHVWGKRGSDQHEIGRAYWVAFTRRPELWLWEAGGLVALAWFIWRSQLYRPARFLDFIVTGRVRSRS